MNIRKAGYFAVGVGIFIIIFSITVDYFGLGKMGIQAAQILGIQAGISVTILGIAIIYHLPQIKTLGTFWRELKERFVFLPTLTLVTSGFIITYIYLFISPVFFNQEHSVQYFNRFLPEIRPIGHDLIFANASIKGWLSGQSLYDNQNLYYPPLYAFIFAPFLLLSYPANFYFITFLTLVSIVTLFFAIPLLEDKSKREISLMAFFFFTAIFSYGMQFEIERGQFNIIAFALAIFSIYLYHYRNSLRYYAYLFFSLSVQIKIYPAVLILMFIKDWRNWKNNILRVSGLAIFNITLLFALGWQTLADYIKALPILLNSTWSRPYNHSIRSYVYGLTNSEYGMLPITTVSWIKQNPNWIGHFLFACYFLCLLAVLLKAYKNKKGAINFNLLLICTIGSMILPSSSVDYKLPILAFPLAMVISTRQVQVQGIGRILEIGILLFLSLAYSVTLFPFIYKPDILVNNFPVLLGILIAVTILDFLETKVSPPAIEDTIQS